MGVQPTSCLPEILDRVFNGQTKLPVLAPVAVRVIQLSSDPLCDAKKLSDTIGSDPGLTARVLKLSNSAYYGFAGRVSDLQQSIVLLGNVTIRNLVLGISVGDMCSKLPKHPYLNSFWEHSLTTACIAHILARTVRHTSQGFAFSAGLLHDFGKMVVYSTFPEQATNVSKALSINQSNICLLEENELEFNHAQVGAWLATNWGFPELLINAIGNHHAAETGKVDDTFAQMLCLADYLSRVGENDVLPSNIPITMLEEPFSKDIVSKTLERWQAEREKQLGAFNSLKAA